MFINGIPVSSLFYYTAFLCLHQYLSPHVCFSFFSSLRYAFLFLSSSSLKLLQTTCFYSHESHSAVMPISSLFYFFILSMHLLPPSCEMPLHSLYNVIVLPYRLFTSSLPHSCIARQQKYLHSMFCMLLSHQVISWWSWQLFIFSGGYVPYEFITSGRYAEIP